MRDSHKTERLGVNAVEQAFLNMDWLSATFQLMLMSKVEGHTLNVELNELGKVFWPWRHITRIEQRSVVLNLCRSIRMKALLKIRRRRLFPRDARCRAVFKGLNRKVLY